MSYNLHISKTKQWMDSESDPITEEDLKKATDSVICLPVVFQQGRLTVFRADSTVISSMIKIASQMNAYVQGDDLEYYNDLTISPPVSFSYTDTNIDTKSLVVELYEWVDSIQVGDTIHHLKFGRGQIESIMGEQQDKEFIVKFADKTKRILAYQASNKYHVVASQT